MYDIAIIGLGPSGSTLARLLSANFKVAAIDKKCLTINCDGFHKSCGGLLSPSAQKALALMGLNLPLSVLVDPQIFTVKTIDWKAGLERFYQRHYINMNRHKFDLWLSSLIPNVVDIFDQSHCNSILKKHGYYEIYFKQKNIIHSIKARKIIGADGSGSLVRRLFAPVPIRRYLCIQESFPSADMNAGLQPYICFFDQDTTDCYGWINNKNGLLTLGAALPLNWTLTPKELFEKIKNKFIESGYNFFSKPALKDAALISRPSSLKQLSLSSTDGTAMLVGEAAGLVSPSSLEGISYALSSAGILSDILINKAPIELYSSNLLKLKVKILLRLLKSPAMYNPTLRKLIMLSGVTSLNISK